MAFEVDEVRSLFDWRSVVVHGTIYFLNESGGPLERQEFERAVDMLRAFMPRTLTTEDPVPWRTTIFGLHVSDVSGRAAEIRTVRGKRAKTTG